MSWVGRHLAVVGFVDVAAAAAAAVVVVVVVVVDDVDVAAAAGGRHLVELARNVAAAVTVADVEESYLVVLVGFAGTVGPLQSSALGCSKWSNDVAEPDLEESEGCLTDMAAWVEHSLDAVEVAHDGSRRLVDVPGSSTDIAGNHKAGAGSIESLVDRTLAVHDRESVEMLPRPENLTVECCRWEGKASAWL